MILLLPWRDIRSWNIDLTLVPSLQIETSKYSAGKYVLHRFWKDECSRWDSKQNEWLWRRRRPKSSIKRVLQGNWLNLQEIQFKNETLAQVFCCEFCEIYKTTPASDYSGINGSGGSIGKQNYNLWYRN